MHPVTIVLLVILVILIGLLVGLYFFGKKTQKKQEEQQAQIEASKQTVSMLVIDKKRMPLKESGLPQMVIDQTPKLLRRSKMPIVKAKVGPKISILIADEKVFDLIPVKKEIKAEVSGLYIVGVKGIRGNLDAPVKKKKGFFARFKKSAEEAQAAQNDGRAILMLLSPYCNASHYFLCVVFYQESFSHFKKDPAFLQDPHSQSYFSLSI